MGHAANSLVSLASVLWGIRWLWAQLGACSYHGNEEILPREEFEARKKAAEELRVSRLTKKTHRLAHMGKDLTGCPLLQAGDFH